MVQVQGVPEVLEVPLMEGVLGVPEDLVPVDSGVLETQVALEVPEVFGVQETLAQPEVPVKVLEVSEVLENPEPLVTPEVPQPLEVLEAQVPEHLEVPAEIGDLEVFVEVPEVSEVPVEDHSQVKAYSKPHHL